MSELNFCFLSMALIETVRDFSIDCVTALPSNHAPISIYFRCPDLRSVGGMNRNLSGRVKELGKIDYFVPKCKSNRQLRCEAEVQSRIKGIRSVGIYSKRERSQKDLASDKLERRHIRERYN